MTEEQTQEDNASTMEKWQEDIEIYKFLKESSFEEFIDFIYTDKNGDKAIYPEEEVLFGVLEMVDGEEGMADFEIQIYKELEAIKKRKENDN